MTNQDFAKKVRENRGSLKSMDPELECINTIGTKELITYTLNSKQIGIKAIAEISRESAKEQNNFVSWVESKKRTKQDIDIYMSKW